MRDDAMKKDSLSIIKEFLDLNGLEIDLEFYLKDDLIDSDDFIDSPDDIVVKIIGDAYGSSNEIVKTVSKELKRIFNIYLGRVQKNQLKKYIDYRLENDFDIFLNLSNARPGQLNRSIWIAKSRPDLKKFVDELIRISNHSVEKAVSRFLENLKTAINGKNRNRIRDYLIFLYSRLISLNEKRKLSLNEIFKSNEKIAKKDLSERDFAQLKTFCESTQEMERSKAILASEDANSSLASEDANSSHLFNAEYVRILEKNVRYDQKSAVIFINVDQRLCDKFASKESFYNYLFNLISSAYKKIQNHKSLVIHVQNIIHEGLNIKWELYAYLTIFAEKFLSANENRAYYKPQEICADLLEQKYKIILTEDEKKFLSKQYSENLSRDSLDDFPKFRSKKVKQLIEFFKNINIGFSFIDCFVLLTDERHQNSKEIEFIKNHNELLLVFRKHKTDDRKIPCPVCGSLKISGNSYSELGVKSWECKNPLCSGRSKTNRGKRYSRKTMLMQDATFDFSKENQISKNLIKSWRKDVVEAWNYEDLYRMITKYFSYVGDTITAINAVNDDLFEQIIRSEKRIPVMSDFNDFLPDSEIEPRLFNSFMDNDFFDYFLYEKEIKDLTGKDLSGLFENNGSKKIKIIHGDSFQILEAIGENRIHNMVTSPPYYCPVIEQIWDRHRI